MGIENYLYATYYQCLGDLNLNRKDYKEAEKYLLRALNMRKVAIPEVHYDISVTLNSQGECARLQLEYNDADDLYDKAMEVRRLVLGDDHIMCHEIINNRALLYAVVNIAEVAGLDVFSTEASDPCPQLDTDGFEKATGMLFESALYLRKKLGDNLHPNLVNVLGNVGVVKQMEKSEKIRFANKLNKAHRAEFKRNEDNISIGPNAPHILYKEIGYTDSKKMVENAILTLRNKLSFPPQHHWFLKFERYNIEESSEDEMTIALNIIREGDYFSKVGKYKSSDDKYEIALELLSDYLGKDVLHPVVTSLVLSMANNYRVEARYPEARALYLRSLSMALKLFGNDSSEVGSAYYGLGELHLGK
jgi:tetratricopeptide (TPR) repeat protein